MALGSTTWLEAVPVVAVAALLLVLPGAVGARLAGLSWATALGVGPLLTTTAIAGGGIVASLVGVDWGVPMLAVSVLALLAACALVGLLLRSRPEPDGAVPTAGPDESQTPASDGSPWSLLVGVALALVVAVLVVVPETARPTAFPQSPDTIFHLGTIQWMVAGHDISALHAGGYASPSGTGFYPAAFHGVAATVAQLTGATAVVAASCVALALAGIVWPLGMLVLARRLFGSGWATTVCAALASVAFAAFPFWLMGYGVLWPNLFGQALLPAALALLLAAVDGPVRARSLLLGLAGLPGLAIAHPNALISFVLIGTLVVVVALLRRAWLLRSTRRGASVAAVGAAVLVVVALAALWVPATLVSKGMRASNPPGPEMSNAKGVVDALFLSPRALSPLWVAGVVVLLGAVVLLVRRRHVWVVLAHVGVMALYLAIALVDNGFTRLFTWPWYNNGPRLGALMVLPAGLLATAALTAAAGWLGTRLGGGDRAAPSSSGASSAGASRARTATLAATAVVALAFVASTAGADIGASRHSLTGYFSAPADQSWASEADLEALRTLGAKVPTGAVVAANPWQGGSYLYLTSDRRVLFPTEKVWSKGGDLELLGADLDRAAKDPAVCAAAGRHRVGYVLTGGSSMTDSRGQERRYAGIDGVGGAPGFSVVGRAGDYTLYRLDACR